MVMLVMVLVRAQQAPLTNEAVLEKLLYQQLKSVLDSVPQVKNGLIVRSQTPDLLGKWLKQKSDQWFLKQGIPVIETNADSLNLPDSLYVLEIQPSRVQIYYYEEGRDLLFRVNRYRRSVELFLPLTVKNAAGRLRYAVSEIVKYEDRLGRSRLKNIENRMFDFTRGERVASKWVKIFLEPVVVTLSTIAVVYLFYVLRSGS